MRRKRREPAHMNAAFLIQLLVNGLVVGTLYGVVAMSFVLIYKATQVVNFAQGELLLIGAWVCWSLLTKYPGAVLARHAADAGVHVRVRHRDPDCDPAADDRRADHFRHHGDDRALDGVPGRAEMDVRRQPAAVSARVHQPVASNFFGAADPDRLCHEPVVSVLMMIGMAWFFRVSKYGLAMRATAFNQQVAQSLGISVKNVFAMAWAISATVSAVAGVVVAVVNGVSSGLSAYGIKVFPAAILGGLDSIGGAVLGGIIIGLLENIAQYIDSEYLHWGNLYEIAPFYVLIIILMIKPYGLFGTKDIERV